jgi:hypothetical protein
MDTNSLGTRLIGSLGSQLKGEVQLNYSPAGFAPIMSAAHLVPAIVVTGASSGLGREFARLAIQDGVALVLVPLTECAPQ